MKAPGPWMLRSTWLSAAKCTMARGRCSASRRSSSARSQMSPCTKRCRASPCSAGQVAQVAGVGERVEVDDRLVGRRQPVEHEVAADEAGAAGDEDGHVGCPSVGVFEAHDVVFAQVAARLHLDDLQRHLARVGQAVHLAQRDVGALVLGQQDDLVAVGDLGRAADHDPVLGAVVVHLQAQAGAGLDHDALDLVARAVVDAVVPAPGAVHLAVQRCSPRCSRPSW
jgi:hypothetical protein